jgi:8-amino-3,8-dideoxy-alpha-D-manno-octulosonate transaminase
LPSGEGGLILTDDEKLFYKAFSSHDMGLVRVNGRLATPEPYAICWGQGRRMTELCGAVAAVQIDKLDAITASMVESKKRIKEGLSGIEGFTFRKRNDADGDSGPFLVMIFDHAETAGRVAGMMREKGLHNVFRLAEYGLHIYYNIPSLVDKVPLSPAGNPWSLSENQSSEYAYSKGACPKSDDLFERAILLPIPSKLTAEQEAQAIEAVKESILESK